MLDPVGDRLRGAAAIDEDGGVLADHDASRRTEDVEAGLPQQQTDVGVDHLGAGDDRQVFEEGLAPVAEERRLDRDGSQCLANRIDHQGGQRLALDVLGDDQQRLAGLGDLLQQRQQVRQRGDLFPVQKHQGVLKDGLLGVEIGDEVGRDEALLEPDAFGDLKLGVHRRGLLDADHTVGSDLRHRLADHLADLGVTRGDRRHLSDGVLAGHRGRRGQQRFGDRVGGLGNSRAQRDRVGAGGDVAQTGLDQRLRQHGGGGGAVTGDVVGLGGDGLDQLRTEVLEGILEVDLAGDRHAVVGDRRTAECLGQHHMPAAGAEGDAHRIGELVDTGLHGAACGLVVFDLLAHGCV